MRTQNFVGCSVRNLNHRFEVCVKKSRMQPMISSSFPGKNFVLKREKKCLSVQEACQAVVVEIIYPRRPFFWMTSAQRREVAKKPLPWQHTRVTDLWIMGRLPSHQLSLRKWRKVSEECVPRDRHRQYKRKDNYITGRDSTLLKKLPNL